MYSPSDSERKFAAIVGTRLSLAVSGDLDTKYGCSTELERYLTKSGYPHSCKVDEICQWCTLKSSMTLDSNPSLRKPMLIWVANRYRRCSEAIEDGDAKADDKRESGWWMDEANLREHDAW